MVNKFRKKPVVIEAMQWDGTPEGAGPIIDWSMSSNTTINYSCNDIDDCPKSGHHLSIPTLEGTMRADAKDWIIKGIQGEFYPCKPDIFEVTYEKVED